MGKRSAQLAELDLPSSRHICMLSLVFRREYLMLCHYPSSQLGLEYVPQLNNQRTHTLQAECDSSTPSAPPPQYSFADLHAHNWELD